MILTIDLGNTRAKFTLFEADGRPAQHWVVAHERLVQELQQLFSHHDEITAVSWCAVGDVPTALTTWFEHAPCKVYELRPTAPPRGIIVDYRTPETLGADRLAAVMGARLLLPNRALLVIDAGTCITFDMMTPTGHFLGGNISPGLSMRLRAMHEHTARLPLVEREGATPQYGCNTETALRSGVVRGIHHEIMGYVAELRQEWPDGCVFLTGGDGGAFDIETKTCDFAKENGAIAADSCIFADELLVARGLYALTR